MEKTHSLLRRQIKRYLGDSLKITPQLQEFIDAVNKAYLQSDVDRNMLERSLELSSQELLQANSEMRAIFQTLPDLFFRLDSGGKVLDCKAGTLSDLYHSAVSPIGKYIQDIPDEEASARFKKAIDRVRTTKSNESFEYSLVINKEKQYYEARLVSLLGNQIFVIIRNLTDQKQIEEERLKVSKLDSIAILAGGIAHDFNNLLTAIAGNIMLAMMTTNKDSDLYNRLAAAEKATERASGLVNQLLTFSKGGAPVKRPVSIGKLLEDTAHFVLSGSNVSCKLSIADYLHTVDIDEGQISQVISNLVINAKQAMPEGGAVFISAANTTVGPEDTQYDTLLEQGKYVSISVEDHGEGIPKDDLDKIFDPYFTTKKMGSGLGLATSYSIIKKHGGLITVKSEQGLGTAFFIHLPASVGTPDSNEEKKNALLKGKGRILLMDDDEMVLEVAEEMLKYLGYMVTFAMNGEEAVSIYKAAKYSMQPFDAVIMDLTVPAGMGGKEAIKKLLEIDPDVKAIVSSGYANEPIMAEYAQYGFKGVLDKPYTFSAFSEALNRIIKIK
jgi:signal transduction histidine kinase/CheY-like chemotaxis protein